MSKAKNKYLLSSMLGIIALAVTNIVAAVDDVIVDPGAADVFVILPKDLRFPEGITANPRNGDIYVATFDGGGTNAVLRYNRHGKLVARNNFPGATPLLGLEFNPKDHKVYICSVGDFVMGQSSIVRIAADFDSSTPPETVAVIPSIGPPLPRTVSNPDTSEDVITFGDFARVPNALAFNKQGDLFVSDSFQGAIFRIDQANTCGDPGSPCSVATVAHDPLLATAGFPPFGANGLALNRQEDTLFIANTGDDRILRLDLTSSMPMAEIFVESINGADGVTFDKRGNLWVAANQADQMVELNKDGRVIAQLGAFLGIRNNGTVKGLLFPASPVIVGDEMFVTNLAIPLKTGMPDAASEPERDVKQWTVARIRLPQKGDHDDHEDDGEHHR